MGDYMPNPSDPKRYENYDFSPGSGKSAAYLLVGLLVALVVGFLFIGSPAGDRGGQITTSPDLTRPAPTTPAPMAHPTPQR
jgi:hypothetical protein